MYIEEETPLKILKDYVSHLKEVSDISRSYKQKSTISEGTIISNLMKKSGDDSITAKNAYGGGDIRMMRTFQSVLHQIRPD